MAFKTLISTAALAAHVEDPSFAVVDCRFALDDTSWGAREYRARHIPGAVHADLDRDLSGPKTGRNGRHPLPDAGALAATFGRLGIGDGIQVVAYDQNAGTYASRLWWLLRWLGHDTVAVLDGGFAKWIAENRPTRAGDEQRSPAAFDARRRDDMWVDVDRVARLKSDTRWRLLDARAPERYRGEQEPIDRAAGHIPGALDHFFKSNLSERGTFKTPDELRAAYSSLVPGGDATHLISYCGSGVTACHNLLALEHAGLLGAKLYPGSWSEWSAEPSREIATGEDRKEEERS